MKKLVVFMLALMAGFSIFLVSCDKEEVPDDNPPPVEKVYVSKVGENKKAVIEEFTGVKCGYCPDGDVRAHDILVTYPGDAFVISYHPQSGGFNTPYAGDEDLRRTWPDELWKLTFSGSQSMPGAFINRRVYGGKRWVGRGSWKTYAEGIMGEVSPLNVGFTSSYSTSTKKLTVTAQVYYTEDMTDQNTKYCLLLEDNVITQQSGNPDPPDYRHDHTFRAGLSDVLGDEIVQSTVKGSMVKKTWTYDNSATNYNMVNCHVIVFVRNASSNEVVSGNQAKAGGSTPL